MLQTAPSGGRGPSASPSCATHAAPASCAPAPWARRRCVCVAAPDATCAAARCSGAPCACRRRGPGHRCPATPAQTCMGTRQMRVRSRLHQKQRTLEGLHAALAVYVLYGRRWTHAQVSKRPRCTPEQQVESCQRPAGHDPAGPCAVCLTTASAGQDIPLPRAAAR